MVTIDIYSDVVCPWCYIGKRKFEAGLELLAGEDLGVDFDVTYRPFQLDPTAAPGAAQPVIETYAKKFGGPEQAAQILQTVTERAAEAGIEFHMDRALRRQAQTRRRRTDRPAAQARSRRRSQAEARPALFDRVCIFFNTLLAFVTLEQLDRVLQNARLHLKPNGRFWLDIFKSRSF